MGRPVAIGIVLCRVAGHAAPDHFPPDAQSVQQEGFVVHDPAGKELGLNGARRRFEALEHFNYVQQATLAIGSGCGVDVLPPEEEAHEAGLGNRLDLPAQAADG